MLTRFLVTMLLSVELSSCYSRRCCWQLVGRSVRKWMLWTRGVQLVHPYHDHFLWFDLFWCKCDDSNRGITLRGMSNSLASPKSLIVAFLRALEMLARTAQSNDDSGIGACIAQCILGCLASLVEYFNKVTNFNSMECLWLAYPALLYTSTHRLPLLYVL